MSGLDVRDREAEALSTLPRPPSNGFLGGDPSAGSPTDTLFTFSPCRHGAWTVSSSGAPCAGARRAVSEGSVSRSAFPADCPHLRIFTYTLTAYVSQDPRSSPHIARFVPVPCGSGVATQFTT